jgi:cardiolipin synthase
MFFKIILTVFFILMIISAVIMILIDTGDSGKKFAWLLVIAFLPVIGVILYFMFGINYRHHWIFNRRHQRFKDCYDKEADESLNHLLFGHDAEAKLRPEYIPLARLTGRSVYPTLTDGNDIEIITWGHRKFELLCEDIKNAKESIHMEYFHFGNDDSSKHIKELLMAKAQEGVKVRFIYENIANLPITSSYYENMRKAGVEVVKFTNPRQHIFDLATRLNFRDHRKIVVIDSKIGYTGGMNINNHYFKEWRDTHMRLTGNAVATLQYIFLDAWMTGGGKIDRPLMHYFPQALPQGESAKLIEEKDPDLRQDDQRERQNDHIERQEVKAEHQERQDGSQSSEVMLNSFQHLEINSVHPVLHDKLVHIVPDEPSRVYPILQFSYEWILLHAKKYIWLQTPYFVPTEPVLHAIKAAALSGVDVRLMLPKRADNIFMRPANKAYYAEALDAGVKVYLRKEFIHAKTFVCDDYVTSIGTANLDYRSFDIDYEVNSYIFDEETAIYYKNIFLKDMEDCTELTAEEWSRRPYYKTFIDSFFRLFAPLM